MNTIELPDTVADIHCFAVEAAEKAGLNAGYVYTHFCPASDTWQADEWRVADNHELGYGCMVYRESHWFWRNPVDGQDQPLAGNDAARRIVETWFSKEKK